MNIVLFFLYTLLSSSGLLLIRYGSTIGNAMQIRAGVLSMELSLFSLAGIVCYAGSFLIYLALVSKAQLTYIYPLSFGVTYLFILIGTTLLFHEPITARVVVGGLLIFSGVLLLNIKP